MKKGTFLWLGRMGLPLSLALCHISSRSTEQSDSAGFHSLDVV